LFAEEQGDLDEDPLDAMFELMEAGVLEEIQQWKCGRSWFAA
jgi:hypothetical protein